MKAQSNLQDYLGTGRPVYEKDRKVLHKGKKKDKNIKI